MFFRVLQIKFSDPSDPHGCTVKSSHFEIAIPELAKTSIPPCSSVQVQLPGCLSPPAPPLVYQHGRIESFPVDPTSTSAVLRCMVAVGNCTVLVTLVES